MAGWYNCNLQVYYVICMHTTLPQLCKEIIRLLEKLMISSLFHHTQEENRFEIVLYLVGTEYRLTFLLLVASL